MLAWLTRAYTEEVIASGKQPIFLVLVGLVGAFGFIRTSTRMIRAKVSWWPGNISAEGIHLHHEVFGIVLMLVCGTLGFLVRTVTPWRELLALAFGIGAGLVLDEFALLLRLKDVYWSQQGRTSIDAVILASVGTLVVAVGVVPFGLDRISDSERGARWITAGLVALNFVLTVLTALKGKLWTALLSVLIPPLAIVGTCRLAQPTSPWARHRYPDRPERRQRAIRRQEHWTRRKLWLFNAIGGAPSQTPSG
jgi:hypothetical protein